MYKYLLLLTIGACSQFKGITGSSCTVTTVNQGALITCDDGSSSFVRNEKGDTGATGQDGNDGESCDVMHLEASPDAPGGGTRITCGETNAVILNGSNGQNGVSYNIVDTIDPCGDSGQHDEVFFRLADGSLVALFVTSSSALTARFSYLKDGTNYQTTDSQNCRFSLVTSGTTRTLTTTIPVVSTISWDVN